jgi:hypothetical protein
VPAFNLANVMRMRVSALLACILLLLCACANRGGDPFTWEERGKFSEAPDRFPAKVLGNYKPAAPAWFDNDRLIFSTGKTEDGWRTRPAGSKQAPEPPKIILLNVRTGKFEVTPYRGIMDCYADGNLVLSAHPDAQPDIGDSTPRPDVQGSKYWYGRFGERLKRMPDSAGIPSFNNASCLPTWYETPDGKRIEQSERGAYERSRKKLLQLIQPLRREDGELRAEFTDRLPHSVALVSEQGEVRRIISPTDLLAAPLRYLHWAKLYRINGLGGMHFWLDPRQATLTQIENPRVPVAASNRVIDFAPVGRLIAFNHMPDRWLREGIYLETPGQAYRLDHSRILAVAGVSPDGCHYAYSRSVSARNSWLGGSNDPLSNPDIVELVSIEFCRGEKQ